MWTYIDLNVDLHSIPVNERGKTIEEGIDAMDVKCMTCQLLQLECMGEIDMAQTAAGAMGFILAQMCSQSQIYPG